MRIAIFYNGKLGMVSSCGSAYRLFADCFSLSLFYTVYCSVLSYKFCD